MSKETSKLINQLKEKLKEENIALYLVTIDGNKERVVSLSPDELNLDEINLKAEQKIFNKYLQATLNFNRKDYE